MKNNKVKEDSEENDCGPEASISSDDLTETDIPQKRKRTLGGKMLLAALD